jgi:hypothetical protein
MLNGYHKYPQTSQGYHLGILVSSLQGITMNDTLIENEITSSHLCEKTIIKKN